jgi:hypothetical protein
MNARIVGARVGVCFLLVGCAQPLAPTVQILPPPGKAFADFQADQRVCSIYTNEQVKPMVDSAARATLGAAAIGTVLGAGLGAAIGGGPALVLIKGRARVTASRSSMTIPTPPAWLLTATGFRHRQSSR